ncbi:MAG TPA: PQQ-binding-like beta-propeller repeat protein [Bryobacteraceae bacterium]
MTLRFFPIASLLLAAFGLQVSGQTDHLGWSDYSGAPDSAQFSALTQINRENVARLGVAWTFETGDDRRYSFNPLVIGSTMYVLAKNNSIVAINAATGKELWEFAPEANLKIITNRGFNYWQSADGGDRRILYSSNHTLREIDASTGKPILTFGKAGRVDLREGLDRDPASISLVQSTTPGRVFENLIIVGSATNQGYGSAPGDIRAYDVRNGHLAWTFHTIPRPGEFGYDTWPKDAWKKIGGANVWGEMSLDVKRGILYAPTASAKYNFHGVDRAGANVFANCLLALDARTGKRLWHFQMVHHDIWDYDDATAPKLLTVQHNGKTVDAVAQVTKQGFLFVFDRVTGQPLWPVEERPVPKSDMPGEQSSPTQPFPTQLAPFARQKFTVDDLSPYLSPEDRAKFRDDLLSARNEGLFTPPSRRNTVEMPGNNGGANWGGAAVDPDAGFLYVVSKDLPAMLKLEPEGRQKTSGPDSPEDRGKVLYRANCQGCHQADRRGNPPQVAALDDIGSRLMPEQMSAVIEHGRRGMPAFSKLSADEVFMLVQYLLNPYRAAGAEAPHEAGPETRYFSGFNFMIASNGLSPIKPPWSSLTAYDLNTGTIRWRIPLGEVPQLAARGIKDTGSHFPKVGPVVTAGGLIFTGTRDRQVRALDSRDGKVLWEAEVPSALEGIPAVYEVGGRQYVVFCAAAQVGINSASQVPVKGAYVAFALPALPTSP